MPESTRGKRLTMSIGEYHRHRHRPLAEAILERAREEGLAGGTMISRRKDSAPAGVSKPAAVILR